VRSFSCISCIERVEVNAEPCIVFDKKDAFKLATTRGRLVSLESGLHAFTVLPRVKRSHFVLVITTRFLVHGLLMTLNSGLGVSFYI
jgi:hypothetical protein